MENKTIKMINKRWEDLLIKINEKSKKQIVKNGETVEVNADKKLFLMRYWFKLISENEEISELETIEDDKIIEDETLQTSETELSENDEIVEIKTTENIEETETDEVIVKKVMKRKR